MDCPKCKIPMVRRKSKFNDGYWWGCANYPNCRITSAEHPDGTVLSTPVDEKVKELRKEAHRIAEKIWGEWNSRKCRNREMYDWLKYNTKSGHIGHMDEAELLLTIAKMEQVLQWSAIYGQR